MFILKVFLNLLFQTMVMYIAAKKSTQLIGPPINHRDIALYLIKTMLLILIAFVPMPIVPKFILLTLFSALVGSAIRSRPGLEDALKETTYIFALMVLMGVVSLQLGIDLRPMGIFLFISLLVILVIRLLDFRRKDFVKILSVVVAMFVVYDTNNILQRNYEGDFIDATLDYFQDFSSILNIQSGMIDE